MNSRFIAKMENILQLYAQPYDPHYPVVCFDERPCFLLDEVMQPIAMRQGHVRKEHYVYEKQGSCALFAAIEPLTGQRLAQVHPHRTKKEFTLFCQAIAHAYPQATQIRLVLDNLNTHDIGAFYDNLPADEALALAQRFAFYFTPYSASWLNMVEIEFSALTRLCLNRRIPTMEKLEAEVKAIIADRNAQRIKIHWQFSVDACREKLNERYSVVNDVNSKFKTI